MGKVDRGARTRRELKSTRAGGDPVPSRDYGVFELREIALDSIDVADRPARRFLGDIAALAESMHDYGLQQPISVRAEGTRFVLTSGLRRLTAARMLRWPSIPAFVRTVSADDAYVVDLVENLQREDLTSEEEADALGQLVRTRGWTLQQVANAVNGLSDMYPSACVYSTTRCCGPRSPNAACLCPLPRSCWLSVQTCGQP